MNEYDLLPAREMYALYDRYRRARGSVPYNLLVSLQRRTSHVPRSTRGRRIYLRNIEGWNPLDKYDFTYLRERRKHYTRNGWRLP